MRVDAIFEDAARQEARSDTARWIQLVDQLTDRCHPDQRAAVLDIGRYVAIVVGRGGGKTFAMIVRFLRRMIRRNNARCFYVAKTKDHARDVIWTDLKNLMRSVGFVVDRDVIYNETRLSMTLTCNGSTLRLVGADKQDDLDSLRGPTYAEIGIDEMGAQIDKIVRYLITEVVGPRLVGAFCLAGTTGKLPMGMWHEITGPASSIGQLCNADTPRDHAVQWAVYRWTLEDAIRKTANRPIPELLELLVANRNYISDNKWSDDNPKKRREIDAEWVQDDTEAIYQYKPLLPDGSPWCRWDPPRVGPLKLAVLPEPFKDWVHIIALDLGSSDPTSINLFATALDDKSCTIYHRWGFDQKRLYAKPIAQLLLGEHLDHAQPGGLIGAIGRWPNGMVADSAHLGQAILDELGDVYGIAIEPAVKGWHYKLGAIEVLKGDFHEGRFKVLAGSTLEEQLMKLQWGLNTRGELVEPRGPRNDAADTAVYGRQLIAEFMTARGEAPPPADDGSPASAQVPRLLGVTPYEPEADPYDHAYSDDD